MRTRESNRRGVEQKNRPDIESGRDTNLIMRIHDQLKPSHSNPFSETHSLLASDVPCAFAAFLPSAISLRFFAANAERRLETLRR